MKREMVENKKLDNKKKLILFSASVVGIIIFLRLFLYFSPNSNFNLGTYNIHHLFTGAVLLIIAVILFLFNIHTIYTIILAGIATGFITDELIYLIATNGSDAAYLTSVSLWGAVIVTSITLLITGGIYYVKHTKH